MEGLLSVWSLWIELCMGKVTDGGTLIAEWGAWKAEGGRNNSSKVMRIVLLERFVSLIGLHAK